MDTPPNHSRKSLTKTWLLAMLATGFACSASAQSFENDFGFDVTSAGNTLIFAGTHEYPGFSGKYSVREDWALVGASEVLRTIYYDESGEWDYGSSTFYRDGEFVSQSFDWDLDFSETLIEGNDLPAVIDLNTSYSLYEVLRSHNEGDSEPYGTTRIDYTVRVTGVDLLETVFGRLPALRFEEDETTVREGNYAYPGTFNAQYTYWMVPGLGDVEGTGSYLDTDEFYAYELTETDLDFDPKPLPILDSDNPVWNMFGYTWDMGGGWQESFEFGSLWTDSFPWVWSDDMQGWLYFEGDRKSVWAWVDRTATWIWTNQELYPWVYDSVTFQWGAIGEE